MRLPDIVVHEGETVEYELTEYYIGTDIQFGVAHFNGPLTDRIYVDTLFPERTKKCFLPTSSTQASKKTAIIFRTAVGDTYLMFVANDFKLRVYDISYHYEGDIMPVFEQAVPKDVLESYE